MRRITHILRPLEKKLTCIIKMSQIFYTLKSSASYLQRSRDILQAKDRSDPQSSILRLNETLDCVAAALLLDSNHLAAQFLDRFLTGAGKVIKDEDLFLQEYAEAKATYHEFAEPYSLFLRNVIALVIALGHMESIETIAKSKIVVENAYEYSDIFISYEAYLLELALGNARETERFRSSNWDAWMEDDIVFEDSRWLAAISIAQNSSKDFETNINSLLETTRNRILSAPSPYGNHFAYAVLGLDLAALLALADKHGLDFDRGHVKHLGLHQLSRA